MKVRASVCVSTAIPINHFHLFAVLFLSASSNLLVFLSPSHLPVSPFHPLTRDCNLTMTMTYMHRHQQLRLLPQKSLDLVNGNARPGITSNPPLPFSRQRHRRFICCFCITSSSSSSSLRCRVGHLILAVPSPHNHLPSMQIFLRRCAQNHVFHGKGPLGTPLQLSSSRKK